MASLKRKAVPLVQTTQVINPGDTTGGLSLLTDFEKEALRVYGLSAAELVDRELDERGLIAEKTLNERGKESIDYVGHIWQRLRGKSSTQAYYTHLKTQYSGGKGYKWPHKYKKPTRGLTQDEVDQYSAGFDLGNRNAKRPFLDPFGRKFWKYEDVDVYLSPSNSVPRRLIVMSTDGARKAYPEVSWRRAELQGKVPLALRMAEWALDGKIGWIQCTFRVIVVSLPLQALLAFPGANAPWEIDDVDENYLEYTGYHWKWPKHAVNPLDARATDLTRFYKPQRVSSKQRLLRPRVLMVYQDRRWVLLENPPKELQYIFISYHWGSFGGLSSDVAGWDRVDQMAQSLTVAAGLRAYFRDEHCNARAEAGRDVKTSDINRMCDIIRGSRFVALLLPDGQPHRMADWGDRLWTLPEGLLAPGDVRVFTFHGLDAQGSVRYDERSMSKSELTAEFWHDDGRSDDIPIRALAEHYDGVTILGRLEMFSAAIAALSIRKTTEYSGADLAYALMGLLHYRIDPDPTDDLFQVIARLSFANDSDRLIERCISLYPTPTKNIRELLQMLAGRDQYESHLWDIKPRCEVVGVGDEPNTVILNDCRAVPIRWKRFPRIKYKNRFGFPQRVSQFVIRSGAWWIITGYTLAFTYAPILIGFAQNTPFFSTKWLWYAVLLFIGIGLLLACFAASAVRRLFGGKVMQSSPHLVAFEGTMPKAELERMIFGSNHDRLHYEPSSTPFASEARHKYVRKANEPEWIAKSLPKETERGHRIFTLVDTGNLSISIFQAKRPPTLAIITGSEGGMLRAVLCSWRFANDCHYRETVIRVPSKTWDQARPTAWIKVSLQSQNDFLSQENKPRLGPPPKAIVSPQSNGGFAFGGSPSSPNNIITSSPLNIPTTLPPPNKTASSQSSHSSTVAYSASAKLLNSSPRPSPFKAASVPNQSTTYATSLPQKRMTNPERKLPTEINTLPTAIGVAKSSDAELSPVSPLFERNSPPREAAAPPSPQRGNFRVPPPSLTGTVYYSNPPASARSSERAETPVAERRHNTTPDLQTSDGRRSASLRGSVPQPILPKAPGSSPAPSQISASVQPRRVPSEPKSAELRVRPTSQAEPARRANIPTYQNYQSLKHSYQGPQIIQPDHWSATSAEGEKPSTQQSLTEDASQSSVADESPSQFAVEEYNKPLPSTPVRRTPPPQLPPLQSNPPFSHTYTIASRSSEALHNSLTPRISKDEVRNSRDVFPVNGQSPPPTAPTAGTSRRSIDSSRSTEAPRPSYIRSGSQGSHPTSHNRESLGVHPAPQREESTASRQEDPSLDPEVEATLSPRIIDFSSDHWQFLDSGSGGNGDDEGEIHIIYA